MANNTKIFIYGALALVAIIFIAEHRSPDKSPEAPSAATPPAAMSRPTSAPAPIQEVHPEIDMKAAFAAATEKGNFVGGWAVEQLSQDKTSYSIQLLYEKGTAPDEFITVRDATIITKSFVRYLVNSGHDPSPQGEKKWVHVTMAERGHESPTGKPLYLALSYGVYSPLNDSIDAGPGLWGK